MLGRATRRVAANFGHQVVDADLPGVDILVPDAIRSVLVGVRPDLVVNCAAMTDVDGCEREPERAFEVNAVGAENVARVAESLGVPLVHVSTDFVFDGTAGRR